MKIDFVGDLFFSISDSSLENTISNILTTNNIEFMDCELVGDQIRVDICSGDINDLYKAINQINSL